MSGKKLTYDIGVDASSGITGVKQFSRAVQSELKRVDTSFDDTATAGERVATVLSTMATDLDDELTRAKTAADALAAALGPELAGKADVGSIVGDLQRMGLTFEDITADADKLGDSLKQLDQVQTRGLESGLGGVSTKVGDIGESARGSKSVLANMIGNSVQDLGNLGGVAGSAGVAIGQMGEYMADAAGSGEGLGSVLRSFGGVAVPLAGITFAVKGISDHFAAVKRDAEANTAQVESFAEALQEGATAAEAVASAMADAGKVTITIGGDTTDVTDRLGRLGLTVEQYGKLVASGKPKIQAWADTMMDAGANTNDVKDILLTASLANENLAEAQRNAATNAKVFGDSQADAATDSAALADAQAKVDAAVKQTTDGFAAAADAVSELAQRQQDLVDGQRAAADAGFALRDAQRDLRKQFDTWAKLTGPDSEASMDDLAAAMDDTAESAGSIADAQVRVRSEAAKANGVVYSASRAQQDWTTSMVGSARQASGPLRDAIVAYIAKVNGIPASRVSKILAATDDQSVQAAGRAVDAVADKKRDAKINAYADTAAAEEDLNYTARERQTVIRIQEIIAGAIGKTAEQGGFSTGAAMLVGESGPELVRLPQGSRVFPHAQSAGMTTNNSATTHVTINTAVIGNRYDTQRVVRQALAESARINGTRPFR